MKCDKCKDDIDYIPNEIIQNCGGVFNDHKPSAKRHFLCNECMEKIEYFLFRDTRKVAINYWEKSLDKKTRYRS